VASINQAPLWRESAYLLIRRWQIREPYCRAKPLCHASLRIQELRQCLQPHPDASFTAVSERERPVHRSQSELCSNKSARPASVTVATMYSRYKTLRWNGSGFSTGRVTSEQVESLTARMVQPSIWQQQTAAEDAVGIWSQQTDARCTEVKMKQSRVVALLVVIETYCLVMSFTATDPSQTDVNSGTL